MNTNSETFHTVPESDWDAFFEMSHTDPAEYEDR